MSRSVTHDDFQGGHGDRYSPIRAHLSDLSIGDANALFEGRSMTHDDFGLKSVEKQAAIRHSSQLQLDPDATFDTSTVYHETYHSLGMGDRPKAVRPSTALQLSGERELTSGYQMDFHNKMEPCIAGELIESVKKGHSDTIHYEFDKVDKGHHIYKSKAPEVAIN